MVNIDGNAYEVILEKSKEDLTLEKLLILNPGSTSTKLLIMRMNSRFL